MVKPFAWSRSIAIIGAGIGGLAAAAGLAQDGHRVFLFDQMDTPKPVGSGIVIQPTGRRALESIGAWAYVADHGRPITRINGVEAETGRTVLNVDYGSDFGLGINRGALFQGLWACALEAGVSITPRTFVTDVKGRWLEHTRGREGPFDLIVDASGVNSRLSPLRATLLPYGALWTSVDWTGGLPTDELSQVYRRADKMLGILPIGRMPGSDTQKAAVFWSLPVNAYEAWCEGGIDAWKEEAGALWPAFLPYLESITHRDHLTMARYTHGTLRRPVNDVLVFIGDASHRTSPQLGQGANMALIDAQALRLALRQHHLSDALRAYVLARRWHVGIYQYFSKMFTPQYQSDSRFLPWMRDRVLYPLSTVPPIPRILRHMVVGTLVPPLGSLSSLDAGISGQLSEKRRGGIVPMFPL